MDREQSNCFNCGAPLAGDYCHACGQRAGRRDLHFSELAGELAEEVLNWDSRLWRTLVPLLFRPGFLTAEYMVGRRARYVPPLRLYLIISFILFLTLSLGPQRAIQISITDPETAAQVEREIASSLGQEAGEEDIDLSLSLGFDAPWVHTLEKRIRTNLNRFKREPQEFVARALDYLPQMMFLLLPLFAVLIRLAYMFSPYHYLQHLVFALHYHSFAYLLYLFGIVIERYAADADGILFFALLVYLIFGLRRAYGSTWKGAVGKSLLIQLVYAVMLGAGLGMAFIVALAVA